LGLGLGLGQGGVKVRVRVRWATADRRYALHVAGDALCAAVPHAVLRYVRVRVRAGVKCLSLG
jgi:hypothetical protein